MMSKRVSIIMLCFIILGNLVTTNTALACELPETSTYSTQSDEMIAISQTTEYINESTYFVETIYVPTVQPYSNSKYGTKTATCYSSGTAIFSVSVTGTFTYDGTSATATSATKTVVGHVSSATLKSSSSYTSGASAIASATVTYNGATLQKTVTLTCDKNGNLS